MDTNQPTGTGLPPSLSDAMERIMANPELISMVASALGKPTPTSNQPPPETPPKKEDPPADATAVLASLPTLLKNVGGKLPENDRTRLLCALKPYVNPHRRDTIDTLLRVSQMTELLQHLNLNSHNPST